MEYVFKNFGRTIVSAVCAMFLFLGLSQASFSVTTTSQKLTPILAMLLFDDGPLSLESHIPVSDETDVSRSIQVQIIFNSKLDEATLDAVSVTLLSNTGTIASALSVEGETLTITPDSALALNTIYTVTLQTTIKNLKGNALEEIYTWQFTTTPDNSAPVARDVLITDNNGNNAEFGDNLTGSYDYFDVDSDAEGASQLLWLRNGAAIAGANSSVSYTLVPADNGALIQFEVQPVAISGATTGDTVQSPALQVVTLPAPVAVADVSSTDEDTPTNFSAVVNDTDADNNINPASIDLNMSNGGIQGSFTDANGNQWSANASGVINFTPALNINGAQITAYTISDTDGLTSEQAELTVTVNPVDDAPVAIADSANTSEDIAVQFSASGNDSDPENNLDPSSIDLNMSVSGIQNSLTDANGNQWAANASGVISFSPALNINGAQITVYKISDATGLTSGQANLTVNVSAVNDAPVAINDSSNVNEDASVKFSASANDTDPENNIDPSTIDLNMSVAGIQNSFTDANGNHWFANTAGNVIFTPALNLNGTQTTNYTISDTDGGTSGQAMLTVNVSAVPDAPVAVADSANTDEDNAVQFSASGNDSDPDNDLDPTSIDLNLSSAGIQSSFTDASGNQWTANASGVINFAPALNLNGAQVTAYTISDMSGLTSAQVNLTVNVSAVPDAPVAVADSANTDEDIAVQFSASANDSDPDNDLDPASIDLNMSSAGIQSSFTDASGNQWAANASGVISFAPALNLNGAQVTAYTISDTGGRVSAPANLTVTVAPVNDAAPVAVADSADTVESTATQFNVTNNDTDIDGNLDTSTVDLNTTSAGIQSSVTDASGNSWVVNSSGLLTFTPHSSFSGMASRSYTVSDTDNAVSAPAVLTIAVSADEILLSNTVYRSCAHALQQGETNSGVYRISADGIAPPLGIYCDQSTDDGGWTLVGSTQTTTLNDQSSAYYADLARLAPNTSHLGIWDGLRSLGDRWDVRFTCRASVEAAADPMDVDLSFYDINWYTEFTTGSDADSCFSEGNGAGADSPVPARRNNLNQSFRRKTDRYGSGFLEGEDSCGDTGDFTVDFDDRGQDSNQSDGTDWGEDDSSRKCGINGVASGQWFVYTRERPRVALIGLNPSTLSLVRGAGILADSLLYNSELAAKITTERYDTIVIGRYASVAGRLDQNALEALAVYGRNGGNVVTEWDGASVFMSQYAPSYRYSATAPDPLGWFNGSIGGGYQRGNNTPITQILSTDPIFENVPDPISAGGSTDYFFSLEDIAPPALSLGHETLATFPGGTASYPDASYPAITRGRYCGGQFISANFDWQDDPAHSGFGPLITNMINNASTPAPADLVDACPVQQRARYAVCGAVQDTLINFGLTGTRVNSCVPANDMQVMFITRNGVVDSTQLQIYLASGGIVITEYDNAHEIYNAAFNGAETQTTKFGECLDNFMPLVQANPQDGFWQNNLFEPPASNHTGCGYDISAFPGITKLGGWTAETTQIGYRDLGLGRVWLLAADWQDNTAQSEQSNGLMRYMVTHSAGGLYGRGGLEAGVVQNRTIDSYLDQNFSPCLVTPYDSNVGIADIQQACTGTTLVLACRAEGSELLQVSAMGSRVEVFEDVGPGANAINTHNGINWYYSPSQSWGYAPAGQAVDRDSCDTISQSNNDRLCWHTSSDQVTAGWRCGSDTGLGVGWERIILQRDGDIPIL